jgi:hypothetical protein
VSDGYDDDFENFDPYEDLMDLTGTEGLPALEDPMIPQATPPRSPLLMGLIVGLFLVIVSIAAFRLIAQDDGTDTSAAPGTSAPSESATTDASGTTEEPSSTSSEPPTSVDVDLPEFTPSGNAVAIAELTLAVDAIGPIKLGTSAPRSVGRLITSLGPPDEDSGAVESTGDYGTCPGDTERIVRWGPFVAIVVVDSDGTQILGGYRLDSDYGGLGSPAANLKTLSGLSLGRSVERLESIYEGFDITYEPHPELDEVFELRSANTGNLLLWGPLGSSSESGGYIRGIYSPDACGRFSQPEE